MTNFPSPMGVCAVTCWPGLPVPSNGQEIQPAGRFPSQVSSDSCKVLGSPRPRVWTPPGRSRLTYPLGSTPSLSTPARTAFQSARRLTSMLLRTATLLPTSSATPVSVKWSRSRIVRCTPRSQLPSGTWLRRRELLNDESRRMARARRNRRRFDRLGCGVLCRASVSCVGAAGSVDVRVGDLAGGLTDDDPANDATVISAATLDALLRFPQDGQTTKGHPPIEQLEWIAEGVRVSVVIQLGPTAVLQNPTFDETIGRFIDEFQPISRSAFATLVDESGFPFGQNPLDGAKEYSTFDALLDEVRLLAQANRVGVTVYDPRSAPGSWQLFFNGRQLAAVIPDLTILEGAGTLTGLGADELVNQAAGDPPGSPSVQRVDLDDKTPCIVTSGEGSLDLTCGGSANIIVDFVAPPITDNGAFGAAITRLEDVARAVMTTGQVIE